MASDEDGTITLGSIMVVIFLLVMVGLLANAGRAITTKIEAQSAADSVAISTATIRARGLNAITAANHLAGELTALVVLHHAIGGDELDEGVEPSLTASERAVVPMLEFFHGLAQTVVEAPPRSMADAFRSYDNVKKNPKAGATVRDAVIRLQKVLTWTYQAQTIGGVLQKIPPPVKPITFAIGLTINTAAQIYEVKIGVEWQILEMLRQGARGTVALKKSLRDVAVPLLAGYSRMIAERTPTLASQTLEVVRKANALTQAATYPWSVAVPGAGLASASGPVILRLPVEAEPKAINPASRSQLVRATYPWVAWWRRPMVAFMKDWLILSLSHQYYKKHTNQFTEEICEYLRSEKDVQLYVLIDLDLRRLDKGQERWRMATGSGRAEELFGVLGAIRKEPPQMISPAIYRQPHPDGYVAYAQAMTYNANPPETTGGGQPRVGWDTLNWVSPVPEFPDDDPAGLPRIRLNWRAKLVPATPRMLGKAVAGFQARDREIGKVLLRLLPDLVTNQFRTH